MLKRLTNSAAGHRIRRTDSLPRPLSWAEYRLPKASEKKVTLAQLGDLHCVIRSGNWKASEEAIPTRTSVCRLMQSKRIVGFMEFREYDLAGVHPDDAFYLMDAMSQSACHCAELLISAFDTDDFFDLFEHGHLLEFATAWRHPSCPEASVWADVANHLIESYFGPAIALLKAFPLEYESYRGPMPFDQRDKPHLLDEAMKRRVAAMVRMYGRRLGFTPAPAPFDEDGWMMKVPRATKAWERAAVHF